SSTCALTRRRRRRCPRRCDPPNQSCEREHQYVARDDGQAFCESLARRVEGRWSETDRFDEDVAHSHERAVQKAPIFGYFARQEPAEGDTEKRCDDTKGRCRRRCPETQERRYRGRHDKTRGDRELI